MSPSPTIVDSGQHLEFNAVPASQPLRWLRLAWQDMHRHWGASLGYGALTVALGWTLLVFCGTHPYFIAAAISGFLLVGPALAAGLVEMSRRYSLGEGASFDDSLAGFARNRTALLEFGAVLAAIAVLWFALSAVLLGSVFNVPAPDMSLTLYHGFFDEVNRQQVLAYLAVGSVLAVAVFAVSAIAVPLIIERHATASQAMLISFRAVLTHLPAMILWSALILVLALVGLAPFLLGMLVVMPLLGHATWHAYRSLVR